MVSCDTLHSQEAFYDGKKEKEPSRHVQMTEGKHQIIQHLLQEYDIEFAQDIQDDTVYIGSVFDADIIIF